MCGTIRAENLTPIGSFTEFRQFFKNDQHYCVATALKKPQHNSFVYLENINSSKNCL
jgi:hypothetical protein